MDRIKNLLLLSFFSIFTAISFGATYTTIASGAWSNTTNVWSLDGVNPCGCAPGSITNGDQIIINHDVTAAGNINLNNNSSLIINATGSFTSGNELNFNNSTASINGNVTVNKFGVNSGAELDLNSAILTINARVEIYGIINIDGGYTLMAGGNVEVYSGGELNLENGGKLDVQGGNITNSGVIDLCTTCCTTTSGNWRNNSNGTVSGSGAARSENGNMRNFGSWAFTVAWCSAGTQQGMPGFENCLTANATCNLVVLPVEFGEISAKVNTNNLVQINWNTVSERDNDHFIVFRMDTEKNWNEVALVKGAGTTTNVQYYSVVDPKATSGVNYYKVRQVDVNGEYTDSDPVSAALESREIHVFPNPIAKDETVNITGIEKGSSVVLLNTSGKIIHQQIAENTSIEMHLSTVKVTSGIYMIQVIRNGQKETKKLVIW